MSEMSDCEKKFYESPILDNFKAKSPFLVNTTKNVKYFPNVQTNKKRCRPKRQPKGTVKVWALLVTSDYLEEEYLKDEVIDLTFSKEEALDWMKQDDSHRSKLFYVKELKNELVNRSKRNAKRSKRKTR